MKKIFFYGLFMDRSLLTEKGFHPATVGRALLSGFRIHIGNRASLVPANGSQAYGVVMELSDEETHALYSEPSVREYRRETVSVELLDTHELVDAHCYNLPQQLALAGANPSYAAQLAELVQALGFDSEYAEEIANFAE
ncbi:MAG: gamma-glutamylcyclotransferase family protein [Longimicrobiales bacterium]